MAELAYAETVTSTPETLGPDETLLPEPRGPSTMTGADHIPFSFEVVGFSPGEPQYGKFVHTVDTLAGKEEDAQFVGIGGTPERPIVAIKMAAELMPPYKVTPVVSWETAPTEDRMRDTLLAYAAEGIMQVLVAPTRAQLEGKTDFEAHKEPVDLLALADKTGEFDRLGVVLRPEESSFRRMTGIGIGGEYDRMATELKLAHFGVTQFVLETAPYTMLVTAMRERDVDIPITPGLLLFTEPYGAIHHAEDARLVVPENLASIHKRHRLDRASSWEARQASMRYNLELGRNLLHFGAPGLHIYTNNNICWLSEFTDGLRQKPSD